MADFIFWKLFWKVCMYVGAISFYDISSYISFIEWEKYTYIGMYVILLRYIIFSMSDPGGIYPFWKYKKSISFSTSLWLEPIVRAISKSSKLFIFLWPVQWQIKPWNKQHWNAQYNIFLCIPKWVFEPTIAYSWGGCDDHQATFLGHMQMPWHDKDKVHFIDGTVS
jgi:hypothetical protein